MARRYPVPNTPAEAVRRWGKNASVSIDIAKLREDMQVIVTVDKPKSRYTFAPSDYYGYELDSIEKIRLSGHPDAIHAMFRMLHIEYARRQRRPPSKQKTKRSIIMEKEDTD